MLILIFDPSIVPFWRRSPKACLRVATLTKLSICTVSLQPCLAEDLATMAGNPDDIKNSRKSLSIRRIVFIHPVWWTGPPAISRGGSTGCFSMGLHRFDEKDGHPFGLEAEERNGDQHCRGGEEDAKPQG
jgi:putative NADPH-quinone reductase